MSKQVYDSGNFSYIDHGGILRKSAKANLYKIDDREVWIPISQIEDDNGEILVIPKWLADKNNLKSKWDDID